MDSEPVDASRVSYVTTTTTIIIYIVSRTIPCIVIVALLPRPCPVENKYYTLSNAPNGSIRTQYAVDMCTHKH